MALDNIDRSVILHYTRKNATHLLHGLLHLQAGYRYDISMFTPTDCSVCWLNSLLVCQCCIRKIRTDNISAGTAMINMLCQSCWELRGFSRAADVICGHKFSWAKTEKNYNGKHFVFNMEKQTHQCSVKILKTSYIFKIQASIISIYAVMSWSTPMFLWWKVYTYENRPSFEYLKF